MTTSEIISFAAMIVALLMLILTGRRDTRGGASEQGEVKSTLRGIANGVDDIRVEQRAMRNDIVNLSVRVGKVEESAKSAHHRIDAHETRLNKLESEEQKNEDQLDGTIEKQGLLAGLDPGAAAGHPDRCRAAGIYH